MQRHFQIMKFQNQNNFLEQQLKSVEEKMEILKQEMEHSKLKQYQWQEHWNTIQLLFEEQPKSENIKQIQYVNKEIQTVIGKISISIHFINKYFFFLQKN